MSREGEYDYKSAGYAQRLTHGTANPSRLTRIAAGTAMLDSADEIYLYEIADHSESAEPLT